MTFPEPVSLEATSLPAFIGSYVTPERRNLGWDFRWLQAFRLGNADVRLGWGSVDRGVLVLIAPGPNRWGMNVALAGLVVMHVDTWEWAKRPRWSRESTTNPDLVAPPGTIILETSKLVCAACLVHGQSDPLVVPQASLERPARQAVDAALEVVKVAVGISVLSQDFTG